MAPGAWGVDITALGMVWSPNVACGKEAYNSDPVADCRPRRPNITMTSAVIANLQKLIGTPRDGALLRFSLGSEYLKSGDAHNARLQLAEALARDPAYSAAWKLLGKALAESGVTVTTRRSEQRAAVLAPTS